MKLRKFTLLTEGLLILGIVLFFLPWTHTFEKSFFFRSGADCFADFFNTINSLSLSPGFNPYHSWMTGRADQIYPPFAYVLCLPFVSLMPEAGMPVDACHASLRAMLVGGFGVGLMSLLFLASLFAACRRFSLPGWTAIILFFSGQAVLCYERGNLILMALAGIMLFLCHCRDESSRLRSLAAFGLAIAVALKVTPVLFGVLWLRRKDFKWLLLAGGITLALSIVPLLFSDYSVVENVRQLMANVAIHEKVYAAGSLSVNPACVAGLFLSQVQEITAAFPFMLSSIPALKCLCVVLGLSAIVFAASLKLPSWQRFFLLASSQILLPASPQQYVFLFFIPSLVALLSEAVYDNAEANVRWGALEHFFLFVLFIVLILPVPLFVFRGTCINFAIQSFLIMVGTMTLVGIHICSIFRSCRKCGKKIKPSI